MSAFQKMTELSCHIHYTNPHAVNVWADEAISMSSDLLLCHCGYDEITEASALGIN